MTKFQQMISAFFTKSFFSLNNYLSARMIVYNKKINLRDNSKYNDSKINMNAVFRFENNEYYIHLKSFLHNFY